MRCRRLREDKPRGRLGASDRALCGLPPPVRVRMTTLRNQTTLATVVPRYFFDVHDDELPAADSEGLELADRLEAGQTAISKLRHLAGPGPPQDDVRRTFAIFVRDDQDQPVLKVAVSYAFQWLDT